MRAVMVVVLPEIPDDAEGEPLAEQMHAVASALGTVVPAPERLIVAIHERADAILSVVAEGET